jgi:hypothetical protein
MFRPRPATVLDNLTLFCKGSCHQSVRRCPGYPTIGGAHTRNLAGQGRRQRLVRLGQGAASIPLAKPMASAAPTPATAAAKSNPSVPGPVTQRSRMRAMVQVSRASMRRWLWAVSVTSRWGVVGRALLSGRSVVVEVGFCEQAGGCAGVV